MRFVNVSILLVSIVFAGTVTQTDWSGGGGEEGPVSNWYDLFWSSDNIDFDLEELKLSFSPIEHIIDGDFEGAYCVHSIDLDGDGDIDIIASTRGDYGKVLWFENIDGSGTTWTEHTVDAYYQGSLSVLPTDIDGDGDIDVLGASVSYNDVSWWENMDSMGAIWEQHTVDGYYDGAASVYSADIDGDGDIDILGAARDTDEITWWENVDGTGNTLIEHTVDDSVDYPVSVYATDIDGDGDIDILGAAFFDDDIAWWENTDGTGLNWTKRIVDDSFWGANSVYSADVDGDGDADIVGAAKFANDITWWENLDGTGTNWIEYTVDGDFGHAYSVHATDVDGDGSIDILGTGYSKIAWWKNVDGIGTIWTKYTVDGDFESANSVHTGDIDGDGNTDILGGGYYNVTWWNVHDHFPAGVVTSSILYADEVCEWSIFNANAQVPPGSSVSYQFRSSQNSSNMGVWSDTVFSQNTPLEGILSDTTRYLQYKAIFETSNPSFSPVLFDVSFSYTLITGTEENESDEVPSWSLSTSQNPSYGFFSALVTVPETGIVELSLYDLSGRVITKTLQEFGAGTHSVDFSGLTEGIYLCKMRTDEFSATERIVIVD